MQIFFSERYTYENNLLFLIHFSTLKRSSKIDLQELVTWKKFKSKIINFKMAPVRLIFSTNIYSINGIKYIDKNFFIKIESRSKKTSSSCKKTTKVSKKKKLNLKFTIDCTHPVEDGILDMVSFVS